MKMSASFSLLWFGCGGNTERMRERQDETHHLGLWREEWAELDDSEKTSERLQTGVSNSKSACCAQRTQRKRLVARARFTSSQTSTTQLQLAIQSRVPSVHRVVLESQKNTRNVLCDIHTYF